jgi:hypothetical protein
MQYAEVGSLRLKYVTAPKPSSFLSAHGGATCGSAGRRDNE